MYALCDQARWFFHFSLLGSIKSMIFIIKTRDQSRCSVELILFLLCYRTNTSELLCQGRGQCECGQCVCGSINPSQPERRYSGSHCQCNDYSCNYDNLQLCGGDAILFNHQSPCAMCSPRFAFHSRCFSVHHILSSAISSISLSLNLVLVAPINSCSLHINYLVLSFLLTYSNSRLSTDGFS